MSKFRVFPFARNFQIKKKYEGGCRFHFFSRGTGGETLQGRYFSKIFMIFSGRQISSRGSLFSPLFPLFAFFLKSIQ